MNILLVFMALAVFALVYILAGRFDRFLKEFVRTGGLFGKGEEKVRGGRAGRKNRGEIEKEISRIVDAFHDHQKEEEEFDERVAHNIIDDPGYIECSAEQIRGK